MITPRFAALALAASLAACSSPPSRVEAPMPTVREVLAARLAMAAIERVARMTDAEVAAELARPGVTDAAKGKCPAEAAPPSGRLAPFLGAPLRGDLLSRT